MSETQTVVLVGHCGPDSFMLRNAVGRILSGSDVIMVNSAEDLATYLEQPSVLLVNRVLDGHFETDSGIELIRQLHTSHPNSKRLLISNYPEAQEEAVSAGALEGFGKSDLYAPVAAERLQAAASADE